MNEYLQDLRRRAGDAFPQNDVARGLNRYRAIVGPTAEEGTDAAAALEALHKGKVPTPAQIVALEKLIRMMRPVLAFRNGTVEPLHADVAPAFPEWAAFSARLQPLAYSVGAIFYDGSTVNPIATGFLATSDLVMTNRHVAFALTHGSGILDPATARIQFGQEYGVLPKEPPVPLQEVVAIHSEHDLALFRLAQPAAGKPLFRFSSADPAAGARVATVGYPMSDTERNPLFVTALFGGIFGVKRAAPGAIVSARRASVFHDCTTLGGNSGSPVLSLETAEVLAVHREGSFLVRNEAVPASIAAAFLSEAGKGEA